MPKTLAYSYLSILCLFTCIPTEAKVSGKKVVPNLSQLQVDSLYPAPFSLYAQREDPIQIYFNEELNPALDYRPYLQVVGSLQGNIAGEIRVDTNQLTFQPSRLLKYGEKIEVCIYPGVLSASANTLAFAYHYQFQVRSLPIEPNLSRSTLVGNEGKDAGEGKHVYTVDVDRDGDIDIISAHSKNNDDLGKIIWYVNEGELNFRPKIIDPQAIGVNHLQACDLDQDGYLDILATVPTEADDRIVWYRNQNNLDFSEGLDIKPPPGTVPIMGINSIQTGDLDGDQDIDLAVCVEFNDMVLWIENQNQNPSTVNPNQFKWHLLTDLTGGAKDVSIADLDQDGRLDIAVAAKGVSTKNRSKSDVKVAWFKNQGDRIFDTRILIRGGRYEAFSIVPADLDGDGEVDLILGSRRGLGAVGRLSWLQSLGEGNFSDEKIITDFGSGIKSVNATDLDGDLDLDIAYVSPLRSELIWYENEGNLVFNRRFVSNVSKIEATQATDVDQDGYVDLVSISGTTGNGRVSLSKNVPALFIKEAFVGEHSDHVLRETKPWVVFSEKIDEASLDPKGFFVRSKIRGRLSGNYVIREDTVFFEPDSPFLAGEPCTLYLNQNLQSVNGKTLSRNFAFEFVSRVEENTTEFRPLRIDSADVLTPVSLQITDLDLDEKLDIIVARSEGGESKVDFYQQKTARNFSKYKLAQDLRGVNDLDILDIKINEPPNLLVSDEIDAEIACYYWQDFPSSPPTFATKNVTTFQPRFVLSTDMDGDGDTDILAIFQEEDRTRTSWLENINGTFSEQVIDENILEASALTVADMDRDGDQDVLIAYAVANRVTWYENDGLLNFAERNLEQELAVGKPTSVQTADLNQDGYMDILVAAEKENSFFWFQNKGNHQFTKRVLESFPEDRVTSKVTATDVDGNGHLDIVYSIPNESKLIWYSNLGGGHFESQARIISDTQTDLKDFFPVDLDNDGDMDVVTALGTEKQLVWLENKPLMRIIQTQLSPAPGDSLISDRANIELFFSEEIDPATARFPNIIVQNQKGDTLAGTIQVSGYQVSFQPESNFTPEDTIYVTITIDVLSKQAKCIAKDYTYFFVIAPAICLEASESGGCAPFPLEINDCSAGSLEIRYIYESGQIPTLEKKHTYKQPGIYNPQQIIFYRDGIDTMMLSKPIEVLPVPEELRILVENEQLAICPESRLTLRVSPAYDTETYEWFREDEDVAFAQGQEIQIQTAGSYRVQAENICGLLASKPLVIPELEVFLPNLFTPNGDGNNDVFRLRSTDLSQLKSIELIVLDRYGNQVYATKNIQEASEKGWDGGSQPSGNYTWTLKAELEGCQGYSAQGRLTLYR